MADIVVPESLLDTTDELKRQERINAHLNDFAQYSAPPPPPAPAPLNPFSGEMADQLLAPFREKADQARAAAGQMQQSITSSFDSLLSPFTAKADEQRQRENPSQYGSALTTLGGTPEAEALTRAGGVADATPSDIEGYIRYAAQQRGIDPNVAVAVAQSEGGLNDPVRAGDPSRGGSYGPFQLNYLPGSVGDRFTKETGLHASDPRAWKAGVDYALDEAAKRGWGQWFGAARAGIAETQGLEHARPVGVSLSSDQSPDAGARPPAARAGELTPDQFTAGQTLSSEDAYAACGPAAAIAFARAKGRNPTLDEAVQMARQVGWTPQQGMAGPASQVALLSKMGIASKMDAPDPDRVAADVQRGNPVILDTPGHYFVAERYDPSTGKFDFGNSARALRASGGNTWFTLDEVSRLGMGAPRTAIFMDNPESPSPSVVAGASQPQAGTIKGGISVEQAQAADRGRSMGYRFDDTAPVENGDDNLYNVQMGAMPIGAVVDTQRTTLRTDPRGNPVRDGSADMFNPSAQLDPSQIEDRRGNPSVVQDQRPEWMGNPLVGQRYASDESGIIYPGDEPLPGGANATGSGAYAGDVGGGQAPVAGDAGSTGSGYSGSDQSPDPEAGAYYSSPVGTSLAPQTAPSTQPSDAVESAAPSPDVAPASLGDQSPDPWTRIGHAIRDAFAPFLPTKEGQQQASQDLRERQATMPGTPQADALAQEPMPFDRVGNEIARKYDLDGLVSEYQDAIRNGDGVRAQNVIRSAQARLLQLAPTVQNEILQTAFGGDYGRVFDNPLGNRETPILGPVGQALGVEEGAKFGVGDLVGTLGSGALEPAQWAGIIGTAIDPLLPNEERLAAAAIPLAGPALRLGVAAVKKAGGVLGDALEGFAQKVGRPLSEPEITGITREWQSGEFLPVPAAKNAANAAEYAARDAGPSMGIVSRETAADAAQLSGQVLGSGVGSAYTESQREGATPESIATAGVEGAAIGGANALLRKGVGPRTAGNILRVTEHGAGARKSDDSDEIFHVVQFGNRTGFDAEARSILDGMLEDAKANGLKKGPFTHEDIMAAVPEYARRHGLDEAAATQQVVSAMAKEDTRDAAIRMAMVMDESNRAMDNIVAQAKSIGSRLNEGKLTTEEADALLGDLQKVVVSHEAIVGQANAASSAGLALRQLQSGVNVKESIARLQSYDSFVRPTLSKGVGELEDVVKNGKVTERSKRAFSDAADALDVSADNLGGERAAQALTPEQAGNLKEFTGAPGVDPVKLSRVWDDQAAAKRLAADLADEAGDTGASAARQAAGAEPDLRPDWTRFTPKKPVSERLGEAAAQGEKDLELRDLVKIRENMKRAIDNGIQRALDTEKRQEVRDEVRRMAATARQQIDDIIKNPGGAGWKEAREDLDLTLRQMREHSNLGERVAGDINDTLNRRLDRYVQVFNQGVEQRIAQNEVRLNQEAKNFIKGVDESIARYGKQQADAVARDKLMGLRNTANELLKQINQDPGNQELRKQFSDVVRDIGTTTLGGAQEATKFYDAEAIRDLSRQFREIVRVMGQNPREIFQTGMADQVDAVLRDLRGVNEQGRKIADQMKSSLEQQGARKMLGNSEPEAVNAVLAGLARVNWDDPASVNKFMDTVAQGSKMGRFIEGMMTFMLSNPVTHGVNLSSNALQGASYFGFKRPFEVAYDSLRHPSNRVFADTELDAATRGLREGFGTGLTMAGEIMRYGTTGEARKRAGALADFSDMRRELLTEKYGPIGVLLHSISTRPLEAGDAIFGQAFYHAHLRALAERKAMELQRTGQKVTPFDILANLDKHLDVVEQAGKLADYSLLKERGWAGRGTAALIRAHGDPMRLVINAVMPFTRVPENFLKQGIDHSIIGAIWNTGHLLAKGATGKLSAAEENERVTKAAAGFALTGLGVLGYKAGMITGEGPEDSALRNEMIAQGWQPRSILVGDRYVSYDSLPVTIPLATVVTAMERWDELKRKGEIKGNADIAAKATGGAIGGAFSSAVSQSFVRQIGDAYDAVNSGGDATKAFGGFAKNYLTRSVPGLVSWMARLGDDYQRENRKLDERILGIPQTEGIRGGFMERIPGARQMLPQKQDVTGEAMRNDGNVPIFGQRLSVRRPDPVVDAFIKAGVNIGDPPPEMKIGSQTVPLGKAEQLAWQRYRGEYLRRFETDLVSQEWNSLPLERRNKILQGAMNDAAEYARKRLLGDIDQGGNADQRLNDAYDQKQRALSGTH